VDYGALFEINSRAFKKNLPYAYPFLDILKVIKEYNGKFTISDDSHGPNDVGLHYANLKNYLLENQINTIYYLERDNVTQTVVQKAKSDILQLSYWSNFSARL